MLKFDSLTYIHNYIASPFRPRPSLRKQHKFFAMYIQNYILLLCAYCVQLRLDMLVTYPILLGHWRKIRQNEFESLFLTTVQILQSLCLYSTVVVLIFYSRCAYILQSLCLYSTVVVLIFYSRCAYILQSLCLYSTVVVLIFYSRCAYILQSLCLYSTVVVLLKNFCSA